MNPLLKLIRESPTAARVAPFFIFLVLTFAQDALGEVGRYWIYFGKTLVGIWFIWAMRPVVKEMRWSISFEAVAVGVAVVVIWVALGNVAMSKVDPAKAWNPFRVFGEGTALAWFFVVVRTLGSALVVPPLEEAFYRSWLYRTIANPKFETLPLTYFSWASFVVTALVFGLAHNEWLAGILCAMGYQWLVLRRGHLGDAMTAHAITNFLLGVWVVWQGDWRFW
jgi:CAAX prenyl protease-like protein